MHFILTGNPISTNHIYRHRATSVYMTKEGHAMKRSYFIQLKQQYKKTKPLDGDIDVRVEFFFGDKKKRDIDNFTKLLYDSASKLVWTDDSQIQSALLIKNFDKKNPRIEMTVN